MKQRPFLLVFASILFLFFPIEWFSEWYRERVSFSDALADDFFGFCLSVIVPLFLMLGLLRVSRLGWYSLICLALVWGTRDAYFFAKYDVGAQWTAVGHLVIFCISLFYFVHPRVRTLYFDPKQQWWKTKTRYATHLPALCFDGTEWHYPVLANISTGGCFMETPRLVPTGTEVTVAVPLPEPFGDSVLRATGAVRWASQDPSKTGFGIQFERLSRRQRRVLARFVHANA